MRTGHTRRDNRRPGLPDINILTFPAVRNYVNDNYLFAE